MSTACVLATTVSVSLSLVQEQLFYRCERDSIWMLSVVLHNRQRSVEGRSATSRIDSQHSGLGEIVVSSRLPRVCFFGLDSCAVA